MSDKRMKYLLGIDETPSIETEELTETQTKEQSGSSQPTEPGKPVQQLYETSAIIDETRNEIVSNYLNSLKRQNQGGLNELTEPSNSAQQSTESETISARRNSQKQRKASLEEYKNKFLHPPKITDRKTVYLSKETRDRLDEIVRRLGERGASVSGFIENMAREHLEIYKDDIDQWKRL